ncbi:hypothetical protein JHS95_13180 [Vibrio parahaemolyticus]|uniref:hypothetical protein n=1 Tax=Vibrio parahaemolyticus TaxID=670 RepID=UPI001F444F6F|nr:hypothetical protein [Vibrio parahaemolyticus]MDQ2215694.1 hypothetical protein [Vibrio parahaemolyticus]UJW93662.1 hypothetical protein JHS95_13180 [Vibrio parahaemolyticus]HBB9946062.1 hypothetical protein [Vibrio parahaemolyticus]HBB9947515.1 hypothetical protein [Vibrio parahaemolyticus]HCM1219254.1 hypothetical protein [Vibrio parahaemolyticus]
MNIHEQTYQHFQQLYQAAAPINEVDDFFIEIFMDFIELLEPYLSERDDLELLIEYMAVNDFEMHQAFISFLLALGLVINDWEDAQC